MANNSVNLNLEYTKAKFETGQLFLDYIADKKMSLKDLKEEEIVQ